MNCTIVRLWDLPPSFETLRSSAEEEGFGFLTRLASRWSNGRYADDEIASVSALVEGGDIVAIGAQTFDEYDPSPEHRRIRHFYVAPHRRQRGYGRTLARSLIVDALALAPRVHLRAAHDVSIAFWDGLGFRRVRRQDRTHEMVRSPA